MNSTLKKVLGILLALAVVVSCGMFARDARLKATDEEIIPDEEITREMPAEEPEEELVEEAVVIEENEEYTVSEVVLAPVAEEEAKEETEEAFNVEEAYKYYMSLETDEEKEEYLNSLTPENKEALLNYIKLMEEQAAQGEEAEETPAEEVVEIVPKTIDLWYEYEGDLHFGIEMTIRSRIGGYGENVTYQWMYSTDRENWKPISGATGDFYKFVLDETNNWYYWDLVVTEVE